MQLLEPEVLRIEVAFFLVENMRQTMLFQAKI